MATKAIITEQHLTDIADAIREKRGTEDTYKPGEMAEAIKGIEGGSSETTYKLTSYSGYGNAIGQLVNQGFAPDTSELEDASDLFSYFTGTSLDVSAFDFSAATSAENMFMGCRNLTSIDLSAIDFSSLIKASGMFSSCSNVESIKFNPDGLKACTDAASMFASCTALTSVEGLFLPNVTTLSSIFNKCSSMTDFDLSGIKTSSVESMAYMFYGCSSVTSLDLSSLSTAKCSYFSYLFYGCTSLKSVTLGNKFTASSATSFVSMFYGCTALESLDLSELSTYNCTSFTRMFYNCSSLTDIEFGDNFDTGKASAMEYMFYGCTSLTDLDLSGFDTSNKPSMTSFCQDCTSLKSVTFGEFVTSLYGGNHFSGCNSLVSITFESETVVEASSYSLLWAGSSKYPAPATFTGDPTVDSFRIYVDSNLIDEYESDNYWKQFAGYFEAIS